MNKKALLAGGMAVACAAIGIVSLGGGSTVRSVPFDQVATKAERLDVYGKLDRRSVRSIRGANMVAFDLVEENTGRRMAVLYDNPVSGLAANFPAASHAKATGTYDPTQQKFVADRVATKCPSKYDEGAKLSMDAQAAVDRWREAIGAKSGT